MNAWNLGIQAKASRHSGPRGWKVLEVCHPFLALPQGGLDAVASWCPGLGGTVPTSLLCTEKKAASEERSFEI